MTLLAISFHSTGLDILQSQWKEKKQKAGDKAKTFPQSAPPLSNTPLLPPIPWGSEVYSGGLLLVYDWLTDSIVWQVAIDGATGFCLHDNLIYINMLRLGDVVALNAAGQEVQRFSHRSLNNIHTLVPTSRGFLLTSTGTDSIIELDRQGKLLYQWNALDHGYRQQLNGQTRTLDRSLDQRYLFYPTELHTTHVNSARFVDTAENTILATLFQPGTVIAIDRQAGGQATTLVSGLRQPHEIRCYPSRGWIVSDTGNNQVVILNHQWKITQRITRDFNWVQCATPLADGSIIVADTNNHRLVRVHPDDDTFCEIRVFPEHWRIYLVEELSLSDRNFFRERNK